MSLPEGYVFIAGRSRHKALLLLDIAEAAELPADTVRTVNGGYEVPAQMLDEYDKRIQDQDEAIEAPEPEPWTEDTIAESEDTGYEPATPDSSRVKQPRRNAKKDAWLAYAELRPGFDEADRELSRDEIAAKYGD